MKDGPSASFVDLVSFPEVMQAVLVLPIFTNEGHVGRNRTLELEPVPKIEERSCREEMVCVFYC